jgi:D-3-phosphoglycerate dehydrogenase
MPFDILVTAPTLEEAGRTPLEQAGCRLDFVSPAGARSVMERMLATRRYDGVLSRSIPISGVAMASCPTLRVISRAAVGHDAIDLPAATARGIAVLTAPGANTQSVAEFTIGLIIAAARDIPRHDRTTQAGGWERATLGLELHGRTLGLLGYGGIARAVAAVALAIGMRVVAWSPRLDRAGDIAPVERAASPEDLFRRADVLSLHAPLNAATRGIVDAAALALLGRDGILVNTARGGLVDEPALVAALREGRIRAAALDVRPTEPPPPELALGPVPNLILTPHMGAATTVARAATARAAALHLLDALHGRPLPPGSCVNPDVLGRSGHRA